MRYLTLLVVSTTLFLSEVAISPALASSSIRIQNSAQEKAASLRAQLTELETKQAELQTRLKRLDEDLKPESIEHSLAGVGNTHPEDEREQRRRQLEIERKGVQAQLDLLATSHTRLETAITRAETDAYHQSAAPQNDPSLSALPTANESTRGAPTPQTTRRPKKKRARRSRRIAANAIN
jgi:prefoldin subunit 5